MMNIYEVSDKYDRLKNSSIRHSMIQICDNRRIIIEECRKILKFDENTIKLELAKGNITVIGLELKLSNFSERGMIITGSFHSIGFDDSI